MVNDGLNALGSPLPVTSVPPLSHVPRRTPRTRTRSSGRQHAAKVLCSPASRFSRSCDISASFRARFAPLLVLLPAVLVVSFDAGRRLGRLTTLSGTDRLRYALATVESMLLWGTLLVLAARRRGALRWLGSALFVLLGPLAVGTERYFYQQYDTYLNVDAAVFGASFPKSLAGQVLEHAPGLAAALVLPFVAFMGILIVARKWMPAAQNPSRVAPLMAPVCLGLALVVPCSFRTAQAATPDIIWFHAMGGLLGHYARGTSGHVEPGVRHPPYLPVLAATPAVRRNVLFVLTESVRFDASCVAYDPACPRTPFTNELAKQRFPLLEMRSNSSTTAISFGVILSGLGPTETRDAIHSSPLLFDYAHAAGYDTAYWTSQNLMFAHADEFVRDLPVSRRCGATDLDPEADIDMGASDEPLDGAGGARTPAAARAVVCHRALFEHPLPLPRRSPRPTLSTGDYQQIARRERGLLQLLSKRRPLSGQDHRQPSRCPAQR